MGKSIHMVVDIRSILQKPDRELEGMLIDGDRELTGSEVREHAIKCLREGYDVIPSCDHHNKRGHCLGHETNDSEEV